MHDDELFLRTIVDLSRKINLGDRYDWLRASGLVRQLLLDGHPLVDRVNRAHRLKFSFDVPDASGAVDEHTMMFMVADGRLGVSPRKTVNRKEFLSTPLIYGNNRWFTVHEIVDTVAEALGGIHKGDPKEGAQTELAALDAAIQVFGGGTATAQIRGIGHMTIVALKPLAEAVAKKHGISITWTDPKALRNAQGQETAPIDVSRKQIVRKLALIAPPTPGTRSVLEQPPGAAPFPFVIGIGTLDLACGNCGAILAERIESGQISNIVFRCPVCSRYNEAA